MNSYLGRAEEQPETGDSRPLEVGGPQDGLGSPDSVQAKRRIIKEAAGDKTGDEDTVVNFINTHSKHTVTDA